MTSQCQRPETTMPNDASAVSRVAASLLQADLGIISAARRRRKLLRVFGSSSRVAVALLSPPCVDPLRQNCIESFGHQGYERLSKIWLFNECCGVQKDVPASQ